MNDREKLIKIENNIKGIGLEYPSLNIDDMEWLISRVKQLEKNLNSLLSGEPFEIELECKNPGFNAVVKLEDKD